MAKYTNARYPDKINDLVDNDGNVNIPGGGGETPFEWNTEMDDHYDPTDTSFHLVLTEEDFNKIAEKQPIKIIMTLDTGEGIQEFNLVYNELINMGVRYMGHYEGMVFTIDMYIDVLEEYPAPTALFVLNTGDQPEPEDVNDYAGFAAAIKECKDNQSDHAYSNQWTFTFKDADPNEITQALSNIGLTANNVYSTLWHRGSLKIENMTGIVRRKENHQEQVTFYSIPEYFWDLRAELDADGISNFGYETFSGTITLIYSDDQE